MADKPQETTNVVANSKDIWKYLSLFTTAVVALSTTVVVVCIVLFIPLKETRIDNDIMTKLSELEGLKTKVGIIEDRLKEGQFQQTCGENENACTYKSVGDESTREYLTKKLDELESRVRTETEARLSDFVKGLNDDQSQANDKKYVSIASASFLGNLSSLLSTRSDKID